VKGQAEVAKTLEKAWRLVYVQVEPSDVERPVRADEQGLKHFIEALRSLLKAAPHFKTMIITPDPTLAPLLIKVRPEPEIRVEA